VVFEKYNPGVAT